MNILKNIFIYCFFSFFFQIANAQNWETIIIDKTYSNGLLIQNKNNILIKNCTISNPNGSFGIKIVDCQNIKIENCKVISVGNEENIKLEGRKGKFDTNYVFANIGTIYGVHFLNSKNVVIKNSEVFDVFGQGIRVEGYNNTLTSDITIEDNRIAYIYDDGLKFVVNDDQLPYNNPKSKPFIGGIIRNNILHDIGLGVTRLDFARHGMYLKAADILVEGNTIYNCFYGSGISLRNAGIIRNNTIFNCAYACIAYHTQTITSEGSKKVLIENNECRQDYAMDFPMRLVMEPMKEYNHCANGCIYIGLANVRKDSCVFISECIVRKNKCVLFKDYPSLIGNLKLKKNKAVYEGNRFIPMITVNGQTEDHRVVFEDNELRDQRFIPLYFNEKVKFDTTNNSFIPN